MIIIDYNKKRHKQIIDACVLALRQGKVVVYPTDTCYGLAVDAANIQAVKKLYKVKGRNFNKPSSIVVSSIAYAKKIVRWDRTSSALAKKFWPGALTIVSPVVGAGLGRPKQAVEQALRLQQTPRLLSSGTNFLGLRMPKNNIALDLAKFLKKPITATSANSSGQPDCYSANEVLKQFKKQKFKPDIIINAGKLPKRKLSTVVKIINGKIEVLRKGSISVKGDL